MSGDHSLEPDLGMRSQVGLRNITMNKASGGDGIPVELFQILKDDTVKVLHSICQQNWKPQQGPQACKRSVFIPIPKKGKAKECSKYHTIALISQTSKVMLKILQAKLQQYMNHELPDVQAGFRKGRGTMVKLPTSTGSSKKQHNPVTELLPKTQQPPPLAPSLPNALSPLPAVSRRHLLQAISTEEKESYPMSAIQNLHSFDPFADASKGDDLLPAGTEDYIHIRIQQRNSRKTLTTVQGITDNYDKKKLVKAFKKKFACNGTVTEHPEIWRSNSATG